MRYSADLLIYSSILMVLLLILMLSRGDFQYRQRRLFIYLVGTSLLLIISDFTAALLDGNTGGPAILGNRVANFILHAFTTLPFVIWISYFDFHIFKDINKIRRSILNKLPVLMSLLLGIYSEYSGFLYILDKNNHRIIQPGVFSLYILNLSILIAAYILLFRTRKRLERSTKIIFISFPLFSVVAAGIQFFNPELLLIWNGMALGLLFFFYFLEVQDLNKDYLTGLSNRRLGEDFIEKQIRNSSLAGDFSLIMIDLDDFKSINDTYGHGEGDEALKIFSRILTSSFKSDDLIMRYAGDEFMVLIPRKTEGAFDSVYQRLDNNLKQFNNRNVKPYLLQFSAGCTYFDPAVHKDLKHLLNDADQQMYERKKARKLEGISSIRG